MTKIARNKSFDSGIPALSSGLLDLGLKRGS
jgi:hypothetical protein